MNRWIVAAAIPLVFGIALAACIGNGDGTGVLGGPCPSKTPAVAEIEGDVTPDEFFDLVADAMTCPGHVIHLQSEVDYQTGDFGVIFEIDTWIDLGNNVARTDTVWRAASGEALREAEEAGLAEDAERRDMVIIHADARYTGTELIGYPDDENQIPPAKRRPPSCHGIGREALGSLILCEGPLSDWERTVELDVSFRDRAAIALLTTGESSDAEGTSEVTFWLYFDAETLLPLGGITKSTSINARTSFDIITSYETGFVPLDSLPTDLFEPASIGYVEKDAEEPLDSAEIAVYWLGSTFEGSDEYPALALDYALARKRSETLEFNSLAEIVYRPADDEFGRRVVKLGLFTPETWGDFYEEIQGQRCSEAVELNLPGRRATLLRHHHNLAYNPGAPCPPPDRFSAAVYFDDVVVRIEAPRLVSGGEYFDSPYNSEAAMELLARSLALRE